MSVSSLILNLFPEFGPVMGTVVLSSVLIVIGAFAVGLLLRLRPITLR